MFTKLCMDKQDNKGFTLMELVLVLPFISIIFILAYTMIFMTSKSFTSTVDSFSTYEDIRIFQIDIQREANQARKAEEKVDVLRKVNDKEIHIYTDIDGDGIPEIVRYRFKDNNILKDIKKTTLKKYPYKFTGSWSDEKIVLTNVKNERLVNDIINVRETGPNSINQSSKDYRKQTTLDLKVNTGNKNKTINLQILLVTKSRAEAN